MNHVYLLRDAPGVFVPRDVSAGAGVWDGVHKVRLGALRQRVPMFFLEMCALELLPTQFALGLLQLLPTLRLRP